MAPELARAAMVDQDLVGRGVHDARVLDAMGSVPRECFVPTDVRGSAYADRPLPIGWGQTISQPFIVALMAEALELTEEDRVLEVGAGSGYAAAVLGRLCAEVVTVERIRELCEVATANLASGGATNVVVHQADGTLGWVPGAPYDGIVVTAGGPEVPGALVDQLASGGRLVIPVGPLGSQRLVRVRKQADGATVSEDLGGVAFVPLIGAQGWDR